MNSNSAIGVESRFPRVNFQIQPHDRAGTDEDIFEEFLQTLFFIEKRCQKNRDALLLQKNQKTYSFSLKPASAEGAKSKQKTPNMVPMMFITRLEYRVSALVKKYLPMLAATEAATGPINFQYNVENLGRWILFGKLILKCCSMEIIQVS